MERLVSEVSIEGHSAPSWPLAQLHLRSQRLPLPPLFNVSALCVVCFGRANVSLHCESLSPQMPQALSPPRRGFRSHFFNYLFISASSFLEMAVRHRSYTAQVLGARPGGARQQPTCATRSHPVTTSLFLSLSRQVQHVGAGGEHPGWPTVRRLRGEVRRRRLRHGGGKPKKSTITRSYSNREGIKTITQRSWQQLAACRC